MADYSYQELMKMQNDAIRRAEDMQKRARQSAGIEGKQGAVKEDNEFIKKEEPRRVPMPNDYLENLKKYGVTSSDTESKQKQKEANNINQKPNNLYNFEDKMKSVFGDLNIDSDKALILSLILLLSEEKADEMLIMALLYILM